jgi:GTP-binding protein YchF
MGMLAVEKGDSWVIEVDIRNPRAAACEGGFKWSRQNGAILVKIACPELPRSPNLRPFSFLRGLSRIMRAGIVGLPNVGKSTLFNALTSSKAAQSANYPFCTIEPNEGVVSVPDDRLARISKYIVPKKLVPTALRLVDIAGIVKGASEGEGLGNKFLSHIREVDAILQVVRCFEDPDVVHVAGAVNPVSDIETIEIELMLADIQTLENALPKAERTAKSGDKPLDGEADSLRGQRR